MGCGSILVCLRWGTKVRESEVNESLETVCTRHPTTEKLHFLLINLHSYGFPFLEMTPPLFAACADWQMGRTFYLLKRLSSLWFQHPSITLHLHGTTSQTSSLPLGVRDSLCPGERTSLSPKISLLSKEGGGVYIKTHQLPILYFGKIPRSGKLI